MTTSRTVALSLLLFSATATTRSADVIRVNQLGYLPGSTKIAVALFGKDARRISSFAIREALTGKTVYRSGTVRSLGRWSVFPATYQFDFSALRREGGYYIVANGVRSPNFRINRDVYEGTADVLLRYMRQQRSGFNPFLRDSCHTRDGYLVYSPGGDSQFVDVSGGWHDASDYLQYVTTSATATYQMLFAYEHNSGAFADRFRADGLPGPNGVPDILDEARWGLRWLLKMNPARGVFYNQIADDRDYRGFRLPTLDTVSYGLGRMRPVYRATGSPQGLGAYKNRSTGLASTTSKFASAFALGARVFRGIDPALSAILATKAGEALSSALASPGVCQTAPCVSPYFYEEENWIDDAELAASELIGLRADDSIRALARKFAAEEPVTPWMGTDSSRHYQWFPFVNLGHVRLAEGDSAGRRDALRFMKEGIERVKSRASRSPFSIGIAYNWCSNNFISSFLTQLQQYRRLSGDSSYEQLEGATRDWLFGCNPWGTSMIVGVPRGGVSPRDPHSAFSHSAGYRIDGGLVDGPIRASLFGSLRGVTLSRPDQFAEFQNEAVYHDDWADYSSNEPTMDGTAGLTMALSTLETAGGLPSARLRYTREEGAITRLDSTKKVIYLAFTGHEYADGGESIASTLETKGVNASFFFTGDFFRNKNFAPLIRRLVKDGNYVGGHSDKHLLYASWEYRDSTLVTERQLLDDLAENYRAMKPFGLTPGTSPFLIPPYEWHNQEIADYLRRAGVTLVNFTPGTLSNADYTIPADSLRYHASDELYSRILRYERAYDSGLNGFILLMHIGTHPSRQDKLYARLGGLIDELRVRGYTFKKISGI